MRCTSVVSFKEKGGVGPRLPNLVLDARAVRHRRAAAAGRVRGGERKCCNTHPIETGVVHLLTAPPQSTMPKDIKRELEQRVTDLRVRLEDEEVQRNQLRQSGRQALEIADNILQSVEQSLNTDAGAMSARLPRAATLPPIVRPDTAGH